MPKHLALLESCGFCPAAYAAAGLYGGTPVNAGFFAPGWGKDAGSGLIYPSFYTCFCCCRPDAAELKDYLDAQNTADSSALSAKYTPLSRENSIHMAVAGAMSL